MISDLAIFEKRGELRAKGKGDCCCVVGYCRRTDLPVEVITFLGAEGTLRGARSLGSHFVLSLRLACVRPAVTFISGFWL